MAHNGAPAASTRSYGAKARPGAELCTPVPFPPDETRLSDPNVGRAAAIMMVFRFWVAGIVVS